jgi:hypothetical protein
MRIETGLLSDTYNLVQLARETALAKGKNAQAERMGTVINELKTLAAPKPESQEISNKTVPPPVSETMNQSDFKSLLAAASQKAPAQAAQSFTPATASDRNRMVTTMSSANMREMDIARQLGMTLDEVQMVMSTSQKTRPTAEVKK